MKKILSLYKICFKNFFSFSEFIENFKKGKKQITKNCGIIILFLYVCTIFCASTSLTIKNSYQNLLTLGLQNFTPFLLMFTSMLITFLFAFISSLSSYTTGSSEQLLVSLPFQNREIFLAKFLVTYTIDALLGFCLIFIGGITYAVEANLLSNPIFYLVLFFMGFTIPLFSVTFSYLLNTLIFSLGHSVVNKRLLIGIATAVFVIFFILFNTVYQEMNSVLFAKVNSNAFVKRLAEFSLLELVYINIVIGLVILLITFVSVAFLPKYFIISIISFTDEKVTKLNKNSVEKFIAIDTKSKSQKSTLLLRDIKCVFREPVYLLNGPVIILIFPLMIIISCLVAGIKLETISTLFVNIPKQVTIYILTICISLFSVFLANSTNIASTSFSREGKGFNTLKAMPISIKTLCQIKLLHSMLYSFFTTILGVVLLIIFIKILPCKYSIQTYIISVIQLIVLSQLITLCLNIMDIWIDTINPKLKWENPTAAFKQNINTVISIFGSMILIAIIGAFLWFCMPKTSLSLTKLCIFFLVLDYVLLKRYYLFAEKKLKTIE